MIPRICDHKHFSIFILIILISTENKLQKHPNHLNKFFPLILLNIGNTNIETFTLTNRQPDYSISQPLYLLISCKFKFFKLIKQASCIKYFILLFCLFCVFAGFCFGLEDVEVLL